MADVVNFNKAKKAKLREETQAQAAQNRVTFGRNKAEKALTAAQREKAARNLDGAKRED